MKRLVLVLLLLMALAGVVTAIDLNTTYKVAYSGATPIKDLLQTTSPTAASATIASAVYAAIDKDYRVPFAITDEKTYITVKKMELDTKGGRVGFWLEATRDGREVYTRSPVWIANCPINVLVSESEDKGKNEVSQVVKEAPTEALAKALVRYVNDRPLGKAEGDDTYIVYIINSTGSSFGAPLRNVFSTPESFSDIRNGAGNVGGRGQTGFYYSGGATGFRVSYRQGVSANISAVPSARVIDSAKIGVWGSGKTLDLGETPLVLTGFAPATNGSTVAADYNDFSDVPLANNISGAAFSTTGYNNFTLNTAGLARIQSGSYVNQMIRLGWDVNNSYGGDDGLSGNAQYFQYDYWTAGRDPFLELTYHLAPTAAFSANKTSMCYGDTGIQFTDASTNNPTSWLWDFGDTTSSILQNPTHTYAGVGVYTVNLTATNAVGSDSEVKTNYITVNDCTPVAAFGVSDTSVCMYDVITYTDSSSSSPSSWFWLFGDSQDSHLQNPTHYYDTAGLKTVSLKATNTYGIDWENKTDLISVTNCSIPAESITNITGVSPVCEKLTFTWSNPADPLFSGVMVYLDGAFKTNVTGGVATYSKTGLLVGNHTLGTKSINVYGYTNSTWVNGTAAVTAECPPATGGSSGSSDDTTIPMVFAFFGILLGAVAFMGVRE